MYAATTSKYRDWTMDFWPTTGYWLPSSPLNPESRYDHLESVERAYNGGRVKPHFLSPVLVSPITSPPFFSSRTNQFWATGPKLFMNTGPTASKGLALFVQKVRMAVQQGASGFLPKTTSVGANDTSSKGLELEVSKRFKRLRSPLAFTHVVTILIANSSCCRCSSSPNTAATTKTTTPRTISNNNNDNAPNSNKKNNHNNKMQDLGVDHRSLVPQVYYAHWGDAGVLQTKHPRKHLGVLWFYTDMKLGRSTKHRCEVSTLV